MAYTVLNTLLLIGGIIFCSLAIGFSANLLIHGSFYSPGDIRRQQAQPRNLIPRIETLEQRITQLEQKIEKLEGRNATQSKQTPGSLGRPAQRRNRPGSG